MIRSKTHVDRRPQIADQNIAWPRRIGEAALGFLRAKAHRLRPHTARCTGRAGSRGGCGADRHVQGASGSAVKAQRDPGGGALVVHDRTDDGAQPHAGRTARAQATGSCKGADLDGAAVVV